MNLREACSRPDYFLLTGCGSGMSPKAPGTAGSAVAMVLFLPMLNLPIAVQAGLIVVALAVGIVLSDEVSASLNIKDPSFIVWDEFVGMWIAMLWLPSFWWLPVAFLLFRFFDVLKPGPIGWADRELAGGLGIMIDDVIAGLFALGLLQLLNMLVSW